MTVATSPRTCTADFTVASPNTNESLALAEVTPTKAVNATATNAINRFMLSLLIEKMVDRHRVDFHLVDFPPRWASFAASREMRPRRAHRGTLHTPECRWRSWRTRRVCVAFRMGGGGLTGPERPARSKTAHLSVSQRNGRATPGGGGAARLRQHGATPIQLLL